MPLTALEARRLTVCTLLMLLGSHAAIDAHEPLWGETPTIFGPGVFHPEVRFGFMRHGSASSPGDEGSRELEQEYGLQYGINRFVNVRLMVSAVRMDMEENVAGTRRDARVSGIGDTVLSAKYRFHLTQDTGYQASQAMVLGWKIPTGEDDGIGIGGERLPPSDQPGSGRHGVELGYAIDRERLVDSAWSSVFYRHDFGGGPRQGDMIEVDGAYGRWVVRPNVAEDLGINVAVGVHAEASANDRSWDGLPIGNAHRVAGVHVTPIITKGRNQYRAGVFVPLLKAGSDSETDFRYEVRVSWEMFF